MDDLLSSYTIVGGISLKMLSVCKNSLSQIFSFPHRTNELHSASVDDDMTRVACCDVHEINPQTKEKISYPTFTTWFRGEGCVANGL